MKPFWVYILLCRDGSYYTGHTDDLDVRIAQHQSGLGDGYTSKRQPLELAWSQTFSTREEAISAELQIKGWSRKKKEAMIRGDWQEVSKLAQNHQVGEPVHGSTSSPRTDKNTHPVRPEPVEGRGITGSNREMVS